MQYIKAELKEKTLFISMNNTQSGNSFGVVQAEQLSTEISLYKGQFSCMVFSTEGSRFFCAGGNLKKYSTEDPQLGINDNSYIRGVLQDIHQLPVFTIAKVEGDCFGGGMELLSCFDCVVSTPSSMFGLWQRKVGLTFGWGGGARISEKIGIKKTKLLAEQAESISADMAQQLGLVDRVVSAAFLDQYIQDILTRQSHLSMISLRSIKKLGYKDEKDLFDSIWLNSDHKKILGNFQKK